MTIATAAVAVRPLATGGNSVVEARALHREERADGSAEKKGQVIDDGQKAAGRVMGRCPPG
jgi:hypothetical protein